jgi:hypothetical protein
MLAFAQYMKKRHILISFPVLAILGLIILPGLLPMGKGSRSYAKRWHTRLQQVSPLAAGTEEHPQVRSLSLTNGQWLVWVDQNSHSNPFGGTVVTHDSDGDTRVFFGHVCGGIHMRGDDLAQAYSNLFTIPEMKEIDLNE